MRYKEGNQNCFSKNFKYLKYVQFLKNVLRILISCYM